MKQLVLNRIAIIEPRYLEELPQVKRIQASGPLTVSSINPRYFSDPQGKIVYLTGSHTWLNLQDGGFTNPPPPFDYTGYLNFLVKNDLNFFRLWTWEQSKWSVEHETPMYYAPMPYQRTGPGLAMDGMPKFDLTKFNQAYFDRMRQRVIQAGDDGIYVSVMLFDGWSISKQKGDTSLANPWNGHPFNRANNINGIDGDPNQTDSGEAVVSLSLPEVTSFQEAYVKKVIDTINDLDNVLFEVSNETNHGAMNWQNHMVLFIKNYEATKPKQHPVGITSEYPDGDNNELFASKADWISPNGGLEYTPPADGTKVIIADTDHLCGLCGDRFWVWRSFMMGQNPLFMDNYDNSYQLADNSYNINNENDILLRKNLGYTLAFANSMEMAKMIPHGELSSSGYMLANLALSDAEYLVYLPRGGTVTVDLSATKGKLKTFWLNPATGHLSTSDEVEGGTKRTFITPFLGDAVLDIFQGSIKSFYPFQ